MQISPLYCITHNATVEPVQTVHLRVLFLLLVMDLKFRAQATGKENACGVRMRTKTWEDKLEPQG